MQPLIPVPDALALEGRLRSLPSSVRTHGPDWIAAVVNALPTHFSVPAVVPADRASATVTVVAPKAAAANDAATDQADALVPREFPDASYRIEITDDRLEIACREPAGLVAALRTIGCLIDGDTVPCGTVNDRPAFRYRGVHLDLCRHLTQDQGWRLPVTATPRLTEIGSYLVEQDGSRCRGSYSRAEISDVVTHAGALGVLMIPEIELPGHVAVSPRDVRGAPERTGQTRFHRLCLARPSRTRLSQEVA